MPLKRVLALVPVPPSASPTHDSIAHDDADAQPERLAGRAPPTSRSSPGITKLQMGVDHLGHEQQQPLPHAGRRQPDRRHRQYVDAVADRTRTPNQPMKSGHAAGRLHLRAAQRRPATSSPATSATASPTRCREAQRRVNRLEVEHASDPRARVRRPRGPRCSRRRPGPGAGRRRGPRARAGGRREPRATPTCASGAYAQLPALPYTPGVDAAGVLADSGARVYVAGSLSGTYAEYALCRRDQVHPLPDDLSYAQGAALGVPYATAYRALFQRARAAAGETVLVHGASGGVGLATVQFALAAGLTRRRHGRQRGRPRAGREPGRRPGRSTTATRAPAPPPSTLTGERGFDLIVELLRQRRTSATTSPLLAHARPRGGRRQPRHRSRSTRATS